MTTAHKIPKPEMREAEEERRRERIIAAIGESQQRARKQRGRPKYRRRPR